MKQLKPDNEFRAGRNILEFRHKIQEETKDYPQCEDICLDLSDVIFMDSFSFRLVFDFLPKFKKVIPPKNKHIVELYDQWLDSKKGLAKNFE